MKDCKQLIDLIRSGDAGLRQAMEMMYRDAKFLEISKGHHYFCKPIAVLLHWEDFLMESILRFIEKVLQGVSINNCDAYFAGICFNFCQEQCRKRKVPEGYSPLTDSDTRMDELAQAIAPYFEKLSAQCRTLLTLAFYHNPPMGGNEKLAETLKIYGYNVDPSSIPTLIARCKRNLKGLIGSEMDSFI